MKQKLNVFLTLQSAQIGPVALNVVGKSAQIGPVAHKWLKKLAPELFSSTAQESIIYY